MSKVIASSAEMKQPETAMQMCEVPIDDRLPIYHHVDPYGTLPWLNGAAAPDSAFVLTTWHDDETLSEVFDFAIRCASHPTEALDCANPVSTVDMNDCPAQEQQQVEKQLNEVYRRVLAETPAKVGGARPAKPKDSLVAAQRLCVKFREADCKAVLDLWSEGSIRNLQYVGCMREHAQVRIKQLKAFKTQP